MRTPGKKGVNKIIRRKQVILMSETCKNSSRQIAKRTGIPKSTVGEILYRYKTEHRIADKPRSCRPRLLNQRNLKQLDKYIQDHRCVTGRELARWLQKRTHKPISKEIANLYRRRLGYYEVRITPGKKPQRVRRRLEGLQGKQRTGL